jgi:hypothetical protein
MSVWTSPLFKIETYQIKENEAVVYYYKKVNEQLESEIEERILKRKLIIQSPDKYVSVKSSDCTPSPFVNIVNGHI